MHFKRELHVRCLLVGDGDLDLHSGLDGDGGDLLDDLGGGVQVDEPLVDPHLELVPGVGTLSGRSLTGGDPELLGGEADGAGDLQLLVDGAALEVGADLLEVLDVPGSEGDADPVDLGLLSRNSFLINVGHICLDCGVGVGVGGVG